MFRFLVGMALGAAGAYYLQDRQHREELNARMREIQMRSNAVIGESRRILDETRNELGQVVEAGRDRVQQKAERLRSAALKEQAAGGPAGEGEGI